jgi:hypothetical protein
MPLPCCTSTHRLSPSIPASTSPQADQDEYSFALEQLKHQYSHIREQLAEATRAKVEALLQVASRQAAASVAPPQQPQQQVAGDSLAHAAAAPNTPPMAMGGPRTLARAAGSSDEATAAGSSAVSCGSGDLQLPVSSAAADGDGVVHTPGAAPHAGAGHAGGNEQQQQLEHALACLQQVLLSAHRYRMLLAQLKPADVAAAAAAARSAGTPQAPKSKGNKAAAALGGDAAAPPDALDRLGAAAQALEADQQQLLAHAPGGATTLQQLNELVAGLLHHATPTDTSSSSSSGGGGGGGGTQAHPGAIHQLQHAGAVLASKLWKPHAAATTATTTGSRGEAAGPAAGGGSVAPAGVPGADVARLQAALQHEVLLLADECVTALRYIPRLSALSTLIGW